MHYYQKNLGDYYKKAGRLSMLQHGAYTLLIDACYDRERFPTLEQAIEWTWASTTDEIEAVKFVMQKFFVEFEGGIYEQSRIKRELESYKIAGLVNQLIALAREARKKKITKFAGACDQLRAEIKNDPCSKSNDAWTLVIDALKKEHDHSPNQEPLTKNQEPLTILKDISAKASCPKTDGLKKRISKLYGRRESTKWSEKENRAFSKIEINEDEMALIESYCDKKTGSEYRRRDIMTLLNNWNGEVDRARDFQKTIKKSWSTDEEVIEC